MSVNLLDRHEVTDGVDHAPELRAGLLDDHVTDPLETKRAQRVALVLLAADGGLLLLDLQACHQEATSWLPPSGPSAWARRRAAGPTSSTGRPRRAATAAGS